MSTPFWKLLQLPPKYEGTGIAKRTHGMWRQRWRKARLWLLYVAMISLDSSYIETWGNKHYVTTSGLIVSPKLPQSRYSKKRIRIWHSHWHDSDGLKLRYSVSPAVQLWWRWTPIWIYARNILRSYRRWVFLQRGCEGCVNVDVLKRTERRYCICTWVCFTTRTSGWQIAYRTPSDVKESKKYGTKYRTRLKTQ